MPKSNTYFSSNIAPQRAPARWATSCTYQECTLHQLSPYIGKLKSVIAQDLLREYTKPGDLIADPFCGSGTIPLEAASLGRRVYAADANIYAYTLTKAKLESPPDLESATRNLTKLLKHTQKLPLPDLGSVPTWVKDFFHPQTLKETIRLSTYSKQQGEYFFLACILGILHHQRPGFLSYPSSNLVPYLRSKRFPQSLFPELYNFRSIEPRLTSKVHRALKRPPRTATHKLVHSIDHARIEDMKMPKEIDCVLTSPPYMNALDYVRDNRLRIWLLDPAATQTEEPTCNSLEGFKVTSAELAKQIEHSTSPNACCIFIVAESLSTVSSVSPSRELCDIFLRHARSFSLKKVIQDSIPDIRRSRRRLSGVRREHILVFRKTSNA